MMASEVKAITVMIDEVLAIDFPRCMAKGYDWESTRWSAEYWGMWTGALF